MLKILYFPFVFFCVIHRIERTQISAFMRIRINFPGVDPILSRFQFPYHSLLTIFAVFYSTGDAHVVAEARVVVARAGVACAVAAFSAVGDAAEPPFVEPGSYAAAGSAAAFLAVVGAELDNVAETPGAGFDVNLTVADVNV